MRDGNKHVMTDEIIDIAKRQGMGFESSNEFTVVAGIENATGTVFKNTGENLIILYSRTISYSDTGVNLRIYRDPIYTGGTPLEDIIRNTNDINPQEPNVEIILKGTLSTLTSKGVETRSTERVFGNQTGSGGGSPNQAIYSPQFIKPGKSLYLEIEGRSGGGTQQVSSKLEWVEVPRIPGIVSDDNYVTARYTGVSLNEPS